VFSILWLWEAPLSYLVSLLLVFVDGVKVLEVIGVRVILIRVAYNGCWIERREIHLVMFPRGLVAPLRCCWNAFKKLAVDCCRYLLHLVGWTWLVRSVAIVSY